MRKNILYDEETKYSNKTLRIVRVVVIVESEYIHIHKPFRGRRNWLNKKQPCPPTLLDHQVHETSTPHPLPFSISLPSFQLGYYRVVCGIFGLRRAVSLGLSVSDFSTIPSSPSFSLSLAIYLSLLRHRIAWPLPLSFSMPRWPPFPSIAISPLGPSFPFATPCHTFDISISLVLYHPSSFLSFLHSFYLNPSSLPLSLSRSLSFFPPSPSRLFYSHILLLSLFFPPCPPPAPNALSLC